MPYISSRPITTSVLRLFSFSIRFCFLPIYDKGKTFQVVVFMNIGNRIEIMSLISRKEERNFVAHGKSVRWVDCHPLNENYLVSASQDG